MAQEPVVIPDKLYFKIGEVCDLVGVQAHVLRYWETEFSMLSPQKNKSGQRSYRRRDVEMALRIKQLLYKEMFTIAGARKKLQIEQREGSRPNEANDKAARGKPDEPSLFDSIDGKAKSSTAAFSANTGGQTLRQREALRTLTTNLHELRDLLKSSQFS